MLSLQDKHINDAILLAQAHPKKALGFVLDGLKSARANAIHGHGMNPMRIVVKRLVVGKGEYTRRPLQHGRGRMGIMTRYRCEYAQHSP